MVEWIIRGCSESVMVMDIFWFVGVVYKLKSDDLCIVNLGLYIGSVEMDCKLLFFFLKVDYIYNG